MKYIYVGKIVNTHALKGEVRLISDFEYKERVFKKDNTIYIGNEKELVLPDSVTIGDETYNEYYYRKHKQFDMLKFYGIDYINDVLKYKGSKAYVDEEILNLKEDEILISDICNYEVYLDDKLVGKITEYRSDNGNKLVKVNDKYIPYNNNFISKYDKINKRIYFHDIGVFL